MHISIKYAIEKLNCASLNQTCQPVITTKIHRARRDYELLRKAAQHSHRHSLDAVWNLLFGYWELIKIVNNNNLILSYTESSASRTDTDCICMPIPHLAAALLYLVGLLPSPSVSISSTLIATAKAINASCSHFVSVSLIGDSLLPRLDILRHWIRGEE